MKTFLCDDVAFSLDECDVAYMIEDMHVGEVRVLNLGSSGIVVVECIAE